MSEKRIAELEKTILNYYRKLVATSSGVPSCQILRVELKHNSRKKILHEKLYFSLSTPTGKQFEDYILTSYYMPLNYSISKFISSTNFVNYSKYNLSLIDRIKACLNPKPKKWSSKKRPSAPQNHYQAATS